MDKFLEWHKLPMLIQEEIQIKIFSMSIKVIELVIQSVPTKITPCPDGISGKFIKHLRKK